MDDDENELIETRISQAIDNCLNYISERFFNYLIHIFLF